MTFAEVRARSERINTTLLNHPELNSFIFKRECEIKELISMEEMKLHANQTLLKDIETEHTAASLIQDVQASRRHGLRNY